MKYDTINNQKARDIAAQNFEAFLPLFKGKITPSFGYYRVKQALDYYGVKRSSIHNILINNRAEFERDGSVVMSVNDFRKKHPKMRIVVKKNEFLATDDNTYATFCCPNGWYLTAASIVRLGLLLGGRKGNGGRINAVKDMAASIVGKYPEASKATAKTVKKSKNETTILDSVSMSVKLENVKIQNQKLELDLRETRNKLAELAEKLEKLKAENGLLAADLLKKWDAKAFANALGFFANSGKLTGEDLSRMVLGSLYGAVKGVA